MSNWTYSRSFSRFPLMAATGYTLNGKGRNMMYNPESKTCYTVVDSSTQHVRYFWDSEHPKWLQLDEIASTMGFTGECPSWSRLSKFVYETHVTTAKSGIRTHRDFELMAAKKFFWHFHKVIPGTHGNATELDIKGAYAKSVTRNESLYLIAPFRPADDNGAMQKFKNLVPILPKKLRLCLIGFLSTNTMTQWYSDPDKPGELKNRVFKHCYDGGVFNRIHASLAGLYTFLGEMEKIAREDCIRIHTDSLLIKASIPTTNLEAMIRLTKQNDFELAIKGHGNAVLFGLNEGVLGGRIIGNPKLILQQWDAYIKGIERESTRVEELDARLKTLPYKNERFSIRQARELIGRMPSDILI